MKGFCSTIMISLALTVAVTLTVGCGPNINPLEGPSTTKNPLKPSKNECITNEDCKSAFGGMCSVAECVKETSGNYCQYGILDCDDSNACTTDSCDIVTGCVNTAVPVDDSNACTLDACDPATGITHTAIDCDDGDDYTADSCDPATGCVHVQLECLTASDCDDSNACNGVETCVANTCVSGIALDCDDSDACTVDSCDPATGCVNTSLSQGCCTENEQCGSMGTSWGYSVPCLDDTECQPEVPVCLRGQCVPVGLDFGCTVDPIDSPEAYANGETGFCTT